MIDWSDWGQGHNGLFAAVCFRGRGLPLFSWVSTPEELDPSQNRVEEFCIGRLLRHLPSNIRPLVLADRGFGLNRSTVTTTHRLPRLLVGLLLACCLLILAGLRVSPAFRRQVCSRGKLGILNLGYEYYLATPDPPDHLFTAPHHQTG